MADTLSELIARLDALKQRADAEHPWARGQHEDDRALECAAVNAIPALVAGLAEGKRLIEEVKSLAWDDKDCVCIYPDLDEAAEKLESWLGIPGKVRHGE